MLNLQIGDSVVRVMPGFRDELWRMEGYVSLVEENQIVCIIQVDVPRTMTFDRETGVNVWGREYGWLEGMRGSE